jgi:hypothetical protein
VPLDERALAALSHSAMDLDVYCWLAQRLHRVPPGKAQLVPWPSLKEQFGWHYGRIDNFRPVFRGALDDVKGQYKAARFTLDGRGMKLENSPSPIARRLVDVLKTKHRAASASA